MSRFIKNELAELIELVTQIRDRMPEKPKPPAEEPEPHKKWAFSENSKKKLETVKPELQEVVNLALTYSPIDFGIATGTRTLEEQKEKVKEGLSKTLKSKHLTGDAVDVYAFVDGKANWNTIEYYIQIAGAFQIACKKLETNIRWGGAWTSLLSGSNPRELLRAYKHRKAKLNQTPFIDSGHFELQK